MEVAEIQINPTISANTAMPAYMGLSPDGQMLALTVHKGEKEPLYGLATEGAGLFIYHAGATDLAQLTADAVNFTAFTLGGDNLAGALPAIPYMVSIPDVQDIYYRTLGNKQYELADHLGNVRATVSDRLFANADGTLCPQLLSTNTYYPFGMGIKSLSQQGDYRFGFNGKETDSEWSGQHGATYDYGFRIYDARLGRFLSVDPLTKSYPWFTPYQFAGNMPIKYLDLDGLEPKGNDRDFDPFERKETISLSSLWVGLFDDLMGMSIISAQSKEDRDNAIAKQKIASKEVKSLTKAVNYISIGVATFPVMYAATFCWGLASLETWEVLFVSSGKDMLINGSMDVINQYLVQGVDFDKIDWVNVAASAFIKEKNVKNMVASALDFTIKEGKLKDKDPIDATVEFMIRTGADKVFDKYKRANSNDWNEKMGTDLLKKSMRKYVKDVYKEYISETESTPEN